MRAQRSRSKSRLTRCSIPEDIFKLELTAFARLGTLANESRGQQGTTFIPGQVRHKRRQERYSSAPVDSIVVAIPAVPTVQTWNVYASLFDEPVVGGHDSGDRTQEYCKTGHEVQQGSCGVHDLPWNHDPACCYRDEYHASFNVDIPGDVSAVIQRVGGITHFGNRIVKSFDPLMTLAERLVPI
jgi:hypothetical protein